jgi:hypothetical protein
MTVDDALREIRPTDPAPTVEDLGGLDAVAAAVPRLEPEVLPRLVEAVAMWPEATGHPELTRSMVDRLPEVLPPLDSAGCVDAPLDLVVATDDEELARSFMTTLLGLLDGAADSPSLALRAGYAIRAAVDLALIDVGVSAYAVLAALENLPDVRPEMAPGVARAAGRLWEHHDAPFLQRVLEERVLPHEDAAGDGLVELGLDRLRFAFDAPDADSTLDALVTAEQFFDQAREHDENRPDARAFAAACRAVTAFTRDIGDMAAALDELVEARAELERYTRDESAGFKGAVPLRSIADWQVLVATLRALRDHLERPDVLHLRPAVEALADAYFGMRLGVLEDSRRGLIGFIRPLVRAQVETSVPLTEAMEQLATEEDSPLGARELVGEVVRPKATRCLSAPPRRRARRLP